MTRVVYFGMTGSFSIPPLEQLISADINVCAVVVPEISPTVDPLPRRLEPSAPSKSELPIVNPQLDHNALHLAWVHHLPVWEINSLKEAKTLEMLAGLEPDLIVVACFPYIFPPALLQLPRYGCLNLHPSLLPGFRGPTPLFWIARQNERKAGVTLHFMDEGLDTGDIVAQTPLAWPDEITGTEFEYRCAVEGGRLLVNAVQELVRTGELPRRRQPVEESSYFAQPTEQDLLIPTDWPASRAFKFLRGANNWPLEVRIGEQRFRVRVVVNHNPNKNLDQPFTLHNNNLEIQFKSGTLLVRV